MVNLTRGAKMGRISLAAVTAAVAVSFSLTPAAFAQTPRSWRSPTVRQAMRAERAAHRDAFGLSCSRRRWWDACRAVRRFTYSNGNARLVGSIVFTDRVHWGYGRQGILVTPVQWTVIWPGL